MPLYYKKREEKTGVKQSAFRRDNNKASKHCSEGVVEVVRHLTNAERPEEVFAKWKREKTEKLTHFNIQSTRVFSISLQTPPTMYLLGQKNLKKLYLHAHKKIAWMTSIRIKLIQQKDEKRNIFLWPYWNNRPSF